MSIDNSASLSVPKEVKPAGYLINGIAVSIYNCPAGVIPLKKDYDWKESNSRAQVLSSSDDNFIPA